MNRFRHIGLVKILPEYLIFLGLFLGGFSISGSFADAPVKHIELAYIEWIAEGAENREYTERAPKADVSLNPTFHKDFFEVFYRAENQAFLIHHIQAQKEKQRYLSNSGYTYTFLLTHSLPISWVYPDEEKNTVILS